MNRRTFLAGAVGGAVTLSGCTTFTGSNSTPTTVSGPLVSADGGAAPHAITVDNSLDRDVTLELVVERAGEAVYNDTTTVPAGTKRIVAGITVETLPADARSLTVRASNAEDGQASVDVSVSRCLGDVVFFYRGDGTLDSTYSTC